MPTFAYHILPPRSDFAATITPKEIEIMGRHWGHLHALHATGAVRFVGRAENGDYGFCVFDAPDEGEARRIAEADPAVGEGLMRVEVHAFAVLIDRPA